MASGDERDRELGMDRDIPRRDFLQGLALGAVALAAGCDACATDPVAAPSSPAAPTRPAPPPAVRPGPAPSPFLRGQSPGQMALGHLVRDATSNAAPADVRDTGEEHDLLVVGAGLAGLAAAYAYRRERPEARVLILDAADEVGGHARRSSFELPGGGRLVSYGGTMELEALDESPREVAALLEQLGFDEEHLVSLRDATLVRRHRLAIGVYFHPRLDPRCGTGWVTGYGSEPWERFFARAPLPPEARAELVTLHATRRDWLSAPAPGAPAMPVPHGDAARQAALASMSWERFLRERMGLGDLAVRFSDLYATDLVGLGCDAVSAYAGALNGPGFAGITGEAFELEPWDGPRYPDGNHTLARCLLRALVPASLPGGAAPDDVFQATLVPGALDAAGSPVRVRLRSVAVRVEHQPGRRGVVAHYRRPDGRAYRVRARDAVVAGWGMMAKRIVPELDAAQRAALERYRYGAVIYANVLLRDWRPLAALGLHRGLTPGGWAASLTISDPLRVGRYAPRYEPDAPTVLTLHKYLHTPGQPVDDQLAGARAVMEGEPFETYERGIREELALLFGSHGLDPARDVLALTVHRWGHGYAMFDFPTRPGLSAEPFRAGRRTLGRIAFAGADAGGSPWTQAALQQGIRAARELLHG